MEKKIYTIIRSICFSVLFSLPIVIIIFSLFRNGTYDSVLVSNTCNTFIIPFVSDSLNDLSSFFGIANDSFVVLFFSYYISVFVYYLCIEILLILLETIHYLFHYFERRVLK